jgi:cytosine/adenosine deaminase-related metal-dependent hydrolase
VLLITDVTVVTVDATRRVIPDGAIVVDGARIVAVDSAVALRARHPEAEVLQGAGMVAIPGLIDAHAHADQSILRGTTDNLPWIPFLDDWIEPYLRRREPADTVAAYRLAALEMIKGGTTCFLSPNVDATDDLGALVDATGDIGVRGVLAHWVTPDADLDAAVERVTRWHGADDDRVQLWFGLMVPRRPGDVCAVDFYPAVAARAAEIGTGITYHFCSEIEDLEYYVDTFGVRPAMWAAGNGALGSNVVLINCCWMDDAEIAVLAETGTHAVYSPSATAKMATGITPAVAMLEAGVNVALGTDGGANNNSHDMIREMKTACLVQNSAVRHAGALTAEAALELATIGGARAIGRADDLGSIETGKRADIVLVDLQRPHTTPVNDVVSSLVFSAHGGDVDTVFVDGRVVMRNREVVGVDEATVMADAGRAAARVRASVLPPHAPRWSGG